MKLQNILLSLFCSCKITPFKILSTKTQTRSRILYTIKTSFLLTLIFTANFRGDYIQTKKALQVLMILALGEWVFSKKKFGLPAFQVNSCSNKRYVCGLNLDPLHTYWYIFLWKCNKIFSLVMFEQKHCN